MLRAIICIGFMTTVGCATADAPTRVQASEDQKWATGPSLDSGLTGTVVVLNKAEASASLLDAGTGRELAKVQVGSGPHEVAISPDGTTAVVANYGQRQPGNTLTVTGALNVTYQQAHLDDPPPGFIDTAPLVVVAGSWKQLVN